VRPMEEFHDVALAYRGSGLHALSIDLDVTAATGIGRHAPRLQEAYVLEPGVDSGSFCHPDIITQS